MDVVFRLVGLVGLGAAFAALGIGIASFYQVNNLVVEDVTNNYINGSLATCTPASDGDYFTFNTSGMCLNPVDLQSTINTIESDIQIINQTSSVNYSIPIAEQGQRIDELQADVNASMECCTTNTILISELNTEVTTLTYNFTTVEERLTVVENNVTVLVTEVTVLQQNVTYITEVVNTITGNETVVNERLDALEMDVGELQLEVGYLQYNVTDIQAEVDSLNSDVNASLVCCQENSLLLASLLNNVSSLDGRVTDLDDIVIILEGNVTSLNGGLTAVEGEVVILDGRVNVTETDIVVINSEINSIEGLIGALVGNLTCECTGNYTFEIDQLQMAVDSLDLRMSSAEGSIVALQNADIVFDARLMSVEGNITTLNALMSIVEGNITSLNLRLTTAEGDIVVLQGDVVDLGDRLDVVEFNLSSLNIRLTTVEGDVISLQNDVLDLGDRITVVEFNISSLSERVDTVEGEVADLDARVTIIEGNVTALNNRLNEAVEGEQGGFLPEYGTSGNVLTSNGSLWSSQPVPMQTPLLLRRTGSNGITCGYLPNPPLPPWTCGNSLQTNGNYNILWAGSGSITHGSIITQEIGGTEAYYLATQSGYYSISTRAVLRSTSADQDMVLRIVLNDTTIALDRQFVGGNSNAGFYVNWVGFLTPSSGMINIRGTSGGAGTYVFTDDTYSQLVIEYLGSW